MLAVMIVAVAMAGAWWLQYYRHFPWVLFFGVFFPAQWDRCDGRWRPYRCWRWNLYKSGRTTWESQV